MEFVQQNIGKLSNPLEEDISSLEYLLSSVELAETQVGV